MKKLLGLLTVSAMALFASADQHGYIQLSIWSPGELPTPEYRIDGLRFALFYGQSRNFRGLDLSPVYGVTRTRGNFTGLGLNGVSVVEQSMTGWQFGFFTGYTAETMTGLQTSLVHNSTDGRARGIQLALGLNLAGTINGIQLPAIYNGADNANGLQIGIWNNVNEEMNGIQLPAIYNGAGIANGLQVGLWNNVNEDMNGLQVGLVNVASGLDGLQFGLINVNFGGPIPFFPFLNAGW